MAFAAASLLPSSSHGYSSWPRNNLIIMGDARSPRHGNYDRLENAGFNLVTVSAFRDQSIEHERGLRDWVQSHPASRMRGIAVNDRPFAGFPKNPSVFTVNTNACQEDHQREVCWGLKRHNFGSDDAIVGLDIWDEPRFLNDVTSGFHCVNTCSNGDCFNHVAALSKVIEENTAPGLPANECTMVDKFAFVNMLPLYAFGDPSGFSPCNTEGSGTTADGRAARFRCYLKRYLDIYGRRAGDAGARSQAAPLLSIDSYPFEIFHRPDWDANGRYSQYHQSLKIQNELAIDYSRPGERIPMFVFVQAGRRWDQSTRTWPAFPTQDQIRWQVYSAIAYGATGVGYFPGFARFVSVPDRPWVEPEYEGGLFDSVGVSSGNLSFISGLNSELRALEPTLLKLTRLATYHKAAAGQEGLNEDLLSSSRRVYNIVTGVSGTDNQYAMFTYFKDRDSGEDYLMVFNKDHARVGDMTPGPTTWTVTLGNSATAVYEMSKSTPGSQQQIGQGTSFTVTSILPGEGRLYKIVDSVDEHLANVRSIRREGNQVYYGFNRGILLVDAVTQERKVAFYDDPPAAVADIAVDGSDVFVVYDGWGGEIVHWDRSLNTPTGIVLDGDGTSMPRAISVSATNVFVGLTGANSSNHILVSLSRPQQQPVGGINNAIASEVWDVEYQASTSPPALLLAAGTKVVRYQVSGTSFVNPTEVSGVNAYDTVIGSDGSVYVAVDNGASLNTGKVEKYTATLSGIAPGWTSPSLGRTRAVAFGAATPDRLLAGSRQDATTAIFRWLASACGNTLAQANAPGLPNIDAAFVHGTGLAYYGSTTAAGRNLFAADAYAPGAATLTAFQGCSGTPLQWTAPGDDGSCGTATQYDLRFSTAPITDANFLQASPLTVPAPQSGGSIESYTHVCGPCSPRYYYALKTRDEASNWSSISNVVDSQTLCPGPGQACPDGSPGQVGEVSATPTRLELFAPTPNPAKQTVMIDFAIPGASSGAPLNLGVFDVAGRRMATLSSGPAKVGRFSLPWRLTSESGSRVREGVYYARLVVGEQTFTKSFVVRR